MRRPLTLATAACLATSGAAAGAGPTAVDDLRLRLQQREAEIVELRRQLDALRQRQPAAVPGGLPEETSEAPAAPRSPPSAGAAVARTASPASSQRPTGVDEADDDELSGALESSLVRQGGRVLSWGTVEVEPELSYIYDEPDRGSRRDQVRAAVTVRLGLPRAFQAELRLPYTVHDRWMGVGTSKGLGDVRVGLTKELLAERESVPAVLAFGYWRRRTGDLERTPPTGTGQDAFQVGLTMTKRHDPVVLFGALSYTAHLGTARFEAGSRARWGDVLGARLGAVLAATPDVSLVYGVSFNSSASSHLNGERMQGSDRLAGVAELGTAIVLARGVFFNLMAAIGVTPAAPRFGLTMSLPVRF